MCPCQSGKWRHTRGGRKACRVEVAGQTHEVEVEEMGRHDVQLARVGLDPRALDLEPARADRLERAGKADEHKQGDSSR